MIYTTLRLKEVGIPDRYPQVRCARYHHLASRPIGIGFKVSIQPPSCQTAIFSKMIAGMPEPVSYSPSGGLLPDTVEECHALIGELTRS